MSRFTDTRLLTDVYELIAALWCCPPDSALEHEKLRRSARSLAIRLAAVDRHSAALLTRFLDSDGVTEEEYIDLFELNPQCALYLGSHSYDEPKSCANAAMSDRNEYMIELSGIYRHFGREPNGFELPDYLPLIVEFLALTAEAAGEPVRDKLIQEYIVPYLPPMRARLDELKTPYVHLLDALEKVLEIEFVEVVNIQTLSAARDG